MVSTVQADCKMYATEKQNRGSDCSLIVVSLTTENNRIRKAVAFSDFTFLLQTFCNLLYCALQVGCQSALQATLHKTKLCGPMWSIFTSSMHFPIVWCAVYIHFAACSLTTNLQSTIQCFASWLSMCKVDSDN